MNSPPKRGNSITTYGLDLAKRVFQVHWVEPDTGELKRKALARAEVAAFFARRAPGVVAMESCGSAHYWGRALCDRGVPTEEVLQEMRTSDPPVQYLVGTPKGRLMALEQALLEKPW